ncbi:hypothetical protein [uncultured Roseobacter sp.]|uniref:hypothetical protein n=1 Tax=uncultured Roseobacter sp. TaxID=114847 RepID=UPI002626CBC6|nr:hypothetical protein [uncultured Roseobacter sp.]
MARHQLSVKTIERSAGRTATAAGAYRAGERIECQREGRVHDYDRNKTATGGGNHLELGFHLGPRLFLSLSLAGVMIGALEVCKLVDALMAKDGPVFEGLNVSPNVRRWTHGLLGALSSNSGSAL